MKFIRRKTQVAIYFGIVIVLFAIICVVHNYTGPIVNVSPKRPLLGKWSFPDRFGRTIFWNLTDAGLLYRHASDDPTDVDQYEWWVKDAVLTVRLPMRLRDRIYHSTVLALRGRKLDDATQEFYLSEVAAGRWQISWIDPDGRRNSVIMTREISSARDDERSDVKR